MYLPIDQMVGGIKGAGGSVGYALWPDEGHGPEGPLNMLSYVALQELALSRCLGGRLQPIGDTFERSSMQFLEHNQLTQ